MGVELWWVCFQFCSTPSLILARKTRSLKDNLTKSNARCRHGIVGWLVEACRGYGEC